MKKESIAFGKGMYKLNDEPNFNYQLNRTILWSEGNLEEVTAAAAKIHDNDSWKKEMLEIAQKAESEGRTKEAIAYYRMCEFFLFDGDPEKKKYYQLAVDLFYRYYNDYFTDGTVIRSEVPFDGVNMPVLYTKASGQHEKPKKGTILLHGGNDSYLEELFFPMLYLAEQGYDVYAFEGPGQGGVLRVQHKCFTYEWEKPVKAVLDYYRLNDVTIIGVSLGGMLAPRAAAFDKRIRYVVAWSVFPSFLSVMLQMFPPLVRNLILLLLKLHAAPVLNMMLNFSAKKDATKNWGLHHGMYAYGATSPYDYVKTLEHFQMADIGPLIDQDVLILGANQDHFIDYRLFSQELNALPNVRSLTFRLFTEKEDASNHCNVGNPKLALDTIVNWMAQIRPEANETS